MTKKDHQEYLQSAHWRELRRRVISERGSVCQRCEMPRWVAELIYDQDLHVHHLTYANKGNEQDEDLEVLCRRCHEVETYGRSELKLPKSATCSLCRHKHYDYRSEFCDPCNALIGPYPSEAIVGGSERYDAKTLTVPFSDARRNYHHQSLGICLTFILAQAANLSPVSLKEILRDLVSTHLFCSDFPDLAGLSYTEYQGTLTKCLDDFDAAMELVLIPESGRKEKGQW